MFALAIASGVVDRIEAHTRPTRDGVPVMAHQDRLPSGCTGAPARSYVRTLTWARIQNVRCSGQPVPSLQQTLALIAASPRMMMEVGGNEKMTTGRPYTTFAAAHRLGVDKLALQFDYVGDATISSLSRLGIFVGIRDSQRDVKRSGKDSRTRYALALGLRAWTVEDPVPAKAALTRILAEVRTTPLTKRVTTSVLKRSVTVMSRTVTAHTSYTARIIGGQGQGADPGPASTLRLTVQPGDLGALRVAASSKAAIKVVETGWNTTNF